MAEVKPKVMPKSGIREKITEVTGLAFEVGFTFGTLGLAIIIWWAVLKLFGLI